MLFVALGFVAAVGTAVVYLVGGNLVIDASTGLVKLHTAETIGNNLVEAFTFLRTGALAQSFTLKQVPNGFIKVDEWMRTSAESVHAIGDVVGGYLLAHAAAHEGMTAVEDIAGQRVAPMDQELVTRCTYSHPQIASVGLTEKQAGEKGIEVKTGKFPFTALGRAIIHGETGGFVKLVANGKTGQLLGAHIVGPNATELIAEPALTQLFQGDAWEIGRNIHPHPTLSEAVMEAALAVDGRAIHI